MKLLAVTLSVVFAASVLSAQTATTPTQPADPTKPADPKATPAKPGTPAAKKDDKKKKEETPVIPGVTIARPNGTFLGLQVVDGQFKLSFYNSKKKPMAADVTRAAASWPSRTIHGDFRTVLNGSGTFFTGARPVQPPYTFIVRLSLLQGDGDDAKAVENYTVQLGG